MQALTRQSCSRTRVYRVFGRPCLSQYQQRQQRLNPHQEQRRGAGGGLLDRLRGTMGIPENTNVSGTLEDNETAGKKKARQAAINKGRANLFDAHPDTERLLPLSKHIKERIPLRPQHGRPWYKTYKIREQVTSRTPKLHVSHRKLNKLANQIAGKPIDYAILQMKFSEKRISKQVERLLLETKQRAKELEMNLDQLVVSEAWVGKGSKAPKRIDMKARGRFGVKVRYRSHMTVRLGRGLTRQDVWEKKAQRALDKIKIAEPVQEESKVRFVRQQWAW